MEEIKFGPSGADPSFTATKQKTIDLPKYLNNVGLNALEISFGRGFIYSDDLCQRVGEECKKYNIEVSVHSPYYINFANSSDEMIEKSIGYVITSLKKLKLLGGKHCVFHTASMGKLERGQALELSKNNLKKLVSKIYEEKLDDMNICPETMGKYTQIGNTEEVVDFCKLDKIFVPTLDFGHLNCLKQGELKTKEDFKIELQKVIDGIGYERAKNLHIHFSRIEFSIKGEIKHLNYCDTQFGPEIEPLLMACKELKLYPKIICESCSNRIEDSLTFKKAYENLK